MRVFFAEPGDEDKAIGADTEKEVEESDFVKSIKSRIIIQPVVASLKRNAEFTFDYLMFIILASYVCTAVNSNDHSFQYAFSFGAQN